MELAILAVLSLVGAGISTGQPIENPPVLEQVPSEVLYRPGKPFVLPCKIEGFSKNYVKYSWQKDGKEFDLTSEVSQRSDEGSLVFQNPKEIFGAYQCFAQTEFGVASSRTIFVKKTYLNLPKEVPVVRHIPVEGKPYKLSCPIPLGYPVPKISWEYQQNIDSSITHNLLDKRIIQGPDGLYFSNVTEKDVSATFKFVCMAESPAVEKSVPIVEHYIDGFDVKDSSYKGELVPQYLSDDMTAKAGDVTMIYCMYGGTPIGHPDWFYEGKNLNGSPNDRITRYNRSAGKRLLIRETLLTDQGTYACEVNNGVGLPAKHSLKLTVVSAPKFIKKFDSSLTVKQGENAILSCRVSALPTATLLWTFNGKPYLGNARVSFDFTGTDDRNAVADLKIKRVQKTDGGYYGCKATNDHGEDYSETLLNVI